MVLSSLNSARAWRPEFAADAAVSVAAERYFGVAVHPAVHPDGAGAQVAGGREGFVDVVAPDPGGESEGGGVGDADGLLESVVGQHGQDGAEDFVGRDGHPGGHVGEDGGLEEAAVEAGVEPVPAGEQVRSGLTAFGHVAFDDGELGVVDEGTDQGVGLERVAYPHVLGAVDDGGGELVGDGAVHDQAAAGVAALADVEVAAEDAGVHRGREVGVGRDDLRVFPAEFEFDLLQVPARGGGDALADAGGAGEADHVDSRVLGDGRTDHPAAGDNVYDAGREPGFADELSQHHRGRGGAFAGLDHGGVACGQGERQFLADDQQREVPGRDHADDADGFVDDHGQGVRSEGIVGLALGVAGEAGRVFPQLRGAGDFVA